MNIRVFLGLGLALLASAPARAALVVSDGATAGVNCSAGVCTATAQDAVLNVKDLRHLLGKSDVALVSGSTAMDIEFDAKLNWARSYRLTLDAYRSITFTKPVAVQGTGGATLVTNDGGSGGDLLFVGNGRLTFWDTSSSLIIDAKNYTLVNDIKTLATDIAVHPNRGYALAKYYDASVDGTYTVSPISTTFAGVFDGLGHTIANYRSSHGGLFANLSAGGVLRNLTLDNTSIMRRVRGSSLGALVDFNFGLVSHVGMSGNISVSRKGSAVGGLIGTNGAGGSVIFAKSSGIVSEELHTGGSAGGLVGINNGTIEFSSSASGTVGDWAGGLVSMNNGTISYSSAAGAVVTGGGKGGGDAGGLVCSNDGSIDQSFATGAVFGGSGLDGESHQYTVEVGGLVAEAFGTITRSYARGATSVGNLGYVGGFAGDAGEEIRGSYSTGTVTYGDSYAGGFVGSEVYNAESDYWNVDTSGMNKGCSGNCSGVTGLTDIQLKSALPTGFDPSIWGQSASINNGYPYLLANPPPTP